MVLEHQIQITAKNYITLCKGLSNIFISRIFRNELNVTTT